MVEEQGKVCRECGQWKPLNDFYRAAGMRDGHRNECKACNQARQAARYRSDAGHRQAMIERVQAWRQANPERFAETQRKIRASPEYKASLRRSHLKRKYGITPEDYDARLAGQGGGCAICGAPPPEGQSLHVDHDHDNGRVRGLLCFNCNAGIGKLGHDVERLERALMYVATKRRMHALAAGADR